MTRELITWQKSLWLLLAYGTLAIGVLGAFLPVLPTTPFLLVSVWAGTNASSKFKWWLLRHKQFGPGLRDWYREKAISRPAKLTAVAVISLSWILIIVTGSAIGVVVFTGLLFICCISYLLTRPDPSNKP